MGRGAATPQNSMGGQPAHSRPGGARVKRPVLGAPLRPQALREVGVQRRKRCMAAAGVGWRRCSPGASECRCANLAALFRWGVLLLGKWAWGM